MAEDRMAVTMERSDWELVVSALERHAVIGAPEERDRADEVAQHVATRLDQLARGTREEAEDPIWRLTAGLVR